MRACDAASQLLSRAEKAPKGIINGRIFYNLDKPGGKKRRSSSSSSSSSSSDGGDVVAFDSETHERDMQEMAAGARARVCVACLRS